MEIECPEFGNSALADGETADKRTVDVGADEHDVIYLWIPDLSTISESLRCDVCGLELTGRNELDEVGVPRSIVNLSADPAGVVQP